jgi:hypothetical protein
MSQIKTTMLELQLFDRCCNKLDFKAALCCSTQETTLGPDEIPTPVVLLSNVTPQSTPTKDKPTGLSEPQRLELGNKSKGSPSPPATTRPGQEKDRLHED